MLESATIITTYATVIIAALAVLSYFFLARWWTTRSGLAMFMLMCSLVLVGIHFVLEAGDPAKQAPVRELIIVWILNAAMLWNAYIIAYKQLVLYPYGGWKKMFAHFREKRRTRRALRALDKKGA